MTEFRPANIGHLFGQEHLTEVLSEWMMDKTKIPHSLLISGPYGTGKTSIARILARTLTDQPRDIKEINAAESRGIDDVRDWVDSARYSPLGQARVYIIDELHQMTQAAQSALLKVIEEPGERMYFFLCTTEPSRLLPAIRSRCTGIEVRLLNEPSALDLINFLSKGKVPEEMARNIYKRAGGHARDIVKMVNVQSHSNYTASEMMFGVGGEEFRALIQKEELTSEDMKKLLAATDPVMVGSVIDDYVDSQVVAGSLTYVKRYDRLLQTRHLRREYKLSAREQLLHLLAETKTIVSQPT